MVLVGVALGVFRDEGYCTTKEVHNFFRIVVTAPVLTPKGDVLPDSVQDVQSFLFCVESFEARDYFH